MSQIIAKERIQIIAGCRIGKAIEPALLRDQLGSTHEAAPGRASKRSANADPPYAQCRDLLHRESAGHAHQHIDRLRRDGGDHGRDVIARADARRVQAIGPGVRVGLEAGDRFAEVRITEAMRNSLRGRLVA